jgi:hypothetical protein
MSDPEQPASKDDSTSARTTYETDPVSTDRNACRCVVQGGERYARADCYAFHETPAVGLAMPNGSVRRGGLTPP